MNNPVLHNKNNNKILATNVVEAKHFFHRLKGLIGRSDLPKEETLLIKHCNSIHTFAMKFPIDVIFVDKNLQVKAFRKNIKPNRLIFPVTSASHVFEFKEGSINENDIKIGDQLYVGC